MNFMPCKALISSSLVYSRGTNYLGLEKCCIILALGMCRGNPSCIYGINGFAMAYNFSMVTQQTIGRSPFFGVPKKNYFQSL